MHRTTSAEERGLTQKPWLFLKKTRTGLVDADENSGTYDRTLALLQ
jgi:hypothetical protein